MQMQTHNYTVKRDRINNLLVSVAVTSLAYYVPFALFCRDYQRIALDIV